MHQGECSEIICKNNSKGGYTGKGVTAFYIKRYSLKDSFQLLEEFS